MNRTRRNRWAGLFRRFYPIAGRLSAATSFPCVGWRERRVEGAGGSFQGGVSGGGGWGGACLKLLMSVFEGEGLLNTGVSLGTIARLKDGRVSKKTSCKIYKNSGLQPFPPLSISLPRAWLPLSLFISLMSFSPTRIGNNSNNNKNTSNSPRRRGCSC